MTDKRTGVLDEPNGPAPSDSDGGNTGTPEGGLAGAPTTVPSDLKGIRRGAVQLFSWPPMAPTVAFVYWHWSSD